MGSIDRLHQNAFFDQVFDVCTIDNSVECQVELVTLVAGAPFGRGRQSDELCGFFAVFLKVVDDPFVARAIRRYAMCFVDDDEIGLRYGIGQYVFGPHTGREQDVVILKSGSRVGYCQLADNVFFAESLFKLFQQHQPVAEHDNLLALVKLFYELARKHGFAGACWRFYDKSLVLLYDRRELVDEVLLPVSELHLDLISKEAMDGQGIVRQFGSKRGRAVPLPAIMLPGLTQAGGNSGSSIPLSQAGYFSITRKNLSD